MQTGVGLTVIGFANEDEWRIGKTCLGDLVVAVGRPKVGQEVIASESEVKLLTSKTLFNYLN